MSRALLLKQLIDARFGGNQSAFADAINRSPAQVNQWLTGHRKLGDAGARTIELALDLRPGYFDGMPAHRKSKPGDVIGVKEPRADYVIDEVVVMLKNTDDEGRLMALGAIRAALAGGTKGH